MVLNPCKMEWKLQLFLLVSSISQILCISNDCPYDFKSLKYICYKPISEMADFRDSVQKCAGTYKLSEYDYLNQELIPVDKLRYFHKERVTKVYGDKKGLFRINAIKFNNTWYEYYHSDLQKVNFNHFEDFDVTQGDNGDTLAFHPMRSKMLFVVPYNATNIGSYWLQPLCFQNRPKSEKCDIHFHKCCGNGDCYNNRCQCYSGWSEDSNCCCASTKTIFSLMESKTNMKPAHKASKIRLKNGDSIAQLTNSHGEIEVDSCSFKKAIESGFLKVDGFCRVHFDMPTIHNSYGSYKKENKISLYLQKSAMLKLSVNNMLNFERMSNVSVIINGKRHFTNDMGFIELYFCEHQTVTYKLENELEFCLPNTMSTTKLKAGMNHVVIVTNPLSELSLHVRNPQACEGVMGAMVHFKETISMTNETGCATITDCTYTKETITISKSGFCNTTIIKRIDSMPSDPVEKETVDLRPIEPLTIVVRDQDQLPLRGMGVSISNDDSVTQKLTDNLGRVNFDLCYGDDVIIQVFGASFETRSCRLEVDSLKFKVGSTNFLNFDAACHVEKCSALDNNPTCCSEEHPCGDDEGGCTDDNQCMMGLRCGFQNCPAGFDPTINCCTNDPLITPPLPPTPIAPPGLSGCSGQCGEGEGGCLSDDQCLPGHICGTPNDCPPGVSDGVRCCTALCLPSVADADCCANAGIPCNEGRGGCTSNDQCAKGLRCGINNCPGGTLNCCTSDACNATANQEDCCSRELQCGLGEGDCNHDNECGPGLRCGFDNCGFTDPTLDCCTNAPCDGTQDDPNCCSEDFPCEVGQGDCDFNSQCQGGVVCGTDNCGRDFPPGFDCCGVCPATNNDADCCATDGLNRCGEGEGACTSDDECADGLICGTAGSCSGTGVTITRCCTSVGAPQVCDPVSGNFDCCSMFERDDGEALEAKCGENQGDCDEDSECLPGFRCGRWNCEGVGVDPVMDCCTQAVCDASANDPNCCATDFLCGVGQGDCDLDSHCQPGLRCGNNNCGAAFTSSDDDGSAFDCCTDQPCTSTENDPNCCSENFPCDVGQGDCDFDFQCMPGLVCGTDNCGTTFRGTDTDGGAFDCCMIPVSLPQPINDFNPIIASRFVDKTLTKLEGLPRRNFAEAIALG